MIYFIYSDEKLVSRQSFQYFFNSDPYLECPPISYYFDRQEGPEENINREKNNLLMDQKFGKNKNCFKKVDIGYSSKTLLLNSKTIKLSRKDTERRVIIPNKITPLLAYEIGTNLGDGCLPSRGDSYRLKGNKNDEIEYYQKVIKPLFKKLYNIEINLSEYTKAYGFECYSKALIDFKTNVIGLSIGSKKKICVPEKLKINNKKILCELIGGLFDTDGAIYFRSQGPNKAYYPVLTISTISKSLANDTSEILKMLGLKVNIYTSKRNTVRTPNDLYFVRMYGYNNFKYFMKLIGTKQPKNLNKIEKWRKQWPDLAG